MSTSQAQQLRNFIDNIVDNEPADNGQFDAKIRSRDLPNHVFNELSLSPESIVEVLESALRERQLSLELSSYYIAHEERLKIFLILSNLCSAPSSTSSSSFHSLQSNR